MITKYSANQKLWIC